MPVTADSTLWTADTTCVTADGRVICIDAEIFEPLHLTPAPDSVTADSTRYRADSTFWTADGLAVGGVITGATDSLDAEVAVIGAVISADVVEAATALDQIDATVYAAEIPVDGGGAYYPPQQRPFPVVGRGYGILPPLWGEAHGTVGVAGKSAAQLLVRAAAAGACGQAGNATAVLKALSVTSKGAVGAHGSGEGVIMKFSGSATGHHDDDEAAVIAFLLAA